VNLLSISIISISFSSNCISDGRVVKRAWCSHGGAMGRAKDLFSPLRRV